MVCLTPHQKNNLKAPTVYIACSNLGGRNCFMPYSFLQLVFGTRQIFAILVLRGISSVKNGML